MKKTVSKTKQFVGKKNVSAKKISKVAKVKVKAQSRTKVKTKERVQARMKVKKVVAKAKPKVRVVAKTKVKPKVKTVTKSKTRVPAKTKAKVLAVRVKTSTQPKALAKAKVVKAVAAKKIKTNVAVHKANSVKKALESTKKRSVKAGSSGEKNAFGPMDVAPYLSKNNEEYMNDDQLGHFRTVLLRWKEQLMAEVDRTMHHMQDEASNYPDPVDRASQEEEFSLELRARDRERKLLKKIEETLGRIKDHDYGYCDDCGAEIGIRRLEARPTATQCIECKTISEIREKQVGDGSGSN